MENLFGTIGTHEPNYLLASNFDTDAIAVSVEPGHGTIPAGAVLYRKSSSVLYAPAAAANIAVTNNLVVLRDDVDTTTSETVAAAAAAYRKAKFIAGKVLVYDGSSAYEPITQAQAIVLRMQNLELSPMDDWGGSAVEADNTAEVSITVQEDSNGDGSSADKQTGTKGDVVTLTAVGKSGYVLDYWEVVSGGVTVGTDGKFTIGDEAVTVKAHFKASV